MGKQNIQATEVYISTGLHVPKNGNSLNTFKNPSSSLTFLKEYGIRLVNVHSISFKSSIEVLMDKESLHTVSERNLLAQERRNSTLNLR